ncbi:MAG: hypothetical protein AAGB24_09515 [Bacteroidota bacterium]
MAQDLRNLFDEERKKKTFKMKEGHEARFLTRLEREMSTQTKHTPFFRWRIAASVLVLLGIGTLFVINMKSVDDTATKIVEKTVPERVKQGISLGDLSPDFQKVENYYVTNINLELSELEVSDQNRGLVDSYMERLAELDEEYKRLNQELNDIGPNDQTITALIKNLQLRLQLLQKLKLKLNQLKSSKNEQKSNHTV